MEIIVKQKNCKRGYVKVYVEDYVKDFVEDCIKDCVNDCKKKDCIMAAV